MTKKQQRHTIASVGTAVLMLLLFLLLWFIRLSAVRPEEEEGVEVAFGEVSEAGGYESQQSEAVPLPAPQPSSPAPSAAPSDNDLMTQEDEEALALRKEQEKKERERRQAEAAEKQRQREEQVRLEAERKAREQAEAERRAKEAEAIANASEWANKFGNNNNADGSGDSQGAGQKGNPIGHGSVGGNSWNLEGREIVGKFPVPQKGQYTPGKVVIEIRVNPQGKVVSARETKGGNVSDKATIEVMLKKAREVQFTESDKKNDQIGYITYVIPD